MLSTIHVSLTVAAFCWLYSVSIFCSLWFVSSSNSWIFCVCCFCISNFSCSNSAILSFNWIKATRKQLPCHSLWNGCWAVKREWDFLNTKLCVQFSLFSPKHLTKIISRHKEISTDLFFKAMLCCFTTLLSQSLEFSYLLISLLLHCLCFSDELRNWIQESLFICNVFIHLEWIRPSWW